MFKDTRIEVLNIVAHLFLCTLVVAGYILLRLNGIDDETFKLSLVAAITYFFGTSGQAVMSNSIWRRRSDTPQSPPPVNRSDSQDKNTHA